VRVRNPVFLVALQGEGGVVVYTCLFKRLFIVGLMIRYLPISDEDLTTMRAEGIGGLVRWTCRFCG
jgi:hypothetical protein